MALRFVEDEGEGRLKFLLYVLQRTSMRSMELHGNKDHGCDLASRTVSGTLTLLGHPWSSRGMFIDLMIED